MNVSDMTWSMCYKSVIKLCVLQFLFTKRCCYEKDLVVTFLISLLHVVLSEYIIVIQWGIIYLEEEDGIAWGGISQIQTSLYYYY